MARRRINPGVVLEDGFPLQFNLFSGKTEDRNITVACTFNKAKKIFKNTPYVVQKQRRLIY